MESFSHCCNPHRICELQVLRLNFPALEPWVVWSVLLPHCSSPFIRMQMWDHLPCQLPPCWESSPPGCPSPPLLPVWINVSSLTSWLLDFHTFRFFGSSGCFLFLNLLLSFFWLWVEPQCVYLHLHLGPKFAIFFFIYLSQSCFVWCKYCHLSLLGRFTVHAICLLSVSMCLQICSESHGNSIYMGVVFFSIQRACIFFIGGFNTFTFKMIINRYIFIAFLLNIFMFLFFS